MQLSGGSTYIISLPKNWVDELKKVGKNVTIVKNSNQSLTLFPKDDVIVRKKAIATYILVRKNQENQSKEKLSQLILEDTTQFKLFQKEY